MDDEDQVDLHEGMQVSNEEGEELGTLAALLVADDEEGAAEDEAEFLILRTGNVERLIPFAAVLGVGDGSLVLDVTQEVLERYPKVRANEDPTDEMIDQAYDVYEETGQYTDEEE